MKKNRKPSTAAEALLMRLKLNGIDYLFGNAGTDFAPIIEAYANTQKTNVSLPEPIVIPHETAAVAMAHGYYLTTGKPQAAMVHVNVGLANSLMGIINTASDNIPFFMMAGRTPITEHDRVGSRMTPVQYGQEMRDQSTMLRESVKWDYELRYPEQISDLVDRGVAISMTEPRGPVYLGLPREPLADKWPQNRTIDHPTQSIPVAPSADDETCKEIAKYIKDAKNPILVTQRNDPEGKLSEEVIKLANNFAVAVIESFPIQNVMPFDHNMHGGYDIAPWLEIADLIIVLDAQVPWIQRHQKPKKGTKIIHIAPDPLFSKMPVRSFQNDLAVSATPSKALELINSHLSKFKINTTKRFENYADANTKRRLTIHNKMIEGDGSPMSPAFVGKCIGRIMDDKDVVFSELGPPTVSLDPKKPNQVFSSPFSGGLGWGLPATLGAALANPNRLNIACVGEGSYIFANPVACHQIAEALELPILVVIMNNGIWNAVRRAARNVYPQGAAKKMNQMPLTSLSPLPDFCKIAEASRGWSKRVENGTDLPSALNDALKFIRQKKRSAVIEVKVISPD